MVHDAKKQTVVTLEKIQLNSASQEFGGDLVLTEPLPKQLVRVLESPMIASRPGLTRTETGPRHVRGKCQINWLGLS